MTAAADAWRRACLEAPTSNRWHLNLPGSPGRLMMKTVDEPWSHTKAILWMGWCITMGLAVLPGSTTVSPSIDSCIRHHCGIRMPVDRTCRRSAIMHASARAPPSGTDRELEGRVEAAGKQRVHLARHLLVRLEQLGRLVDRRGARKLAAGQVHVDEPEVLDCKAPREHGRRCSIDVFGGGMVPRA